MRQTIIGFHPKRKVFNRINKLVRFLYWYGNKLSFSDRFAAKNKFALLEFENKVRKAAEELRDEFEKPVKIS